MMNITGSLLSSWWHNRVPKEDTIDNEKLAEEKEVLKADIL
jgi:hypothetical protein